MKECKKIHPFLSPYLDNLLSPREAGRVAAHLKDCSDARKELEDLKHLRDVLIALPEPKPPHDLHQRIMAKVQGHSLPVHASRPFWFLPAGALAVAAMVTVVVLVQNPDLMSFRNPKYNSLSPEQKNLVATNQPATQVADSLKAQSNRPAPNTQSYAPSPPQSFEPGLAKDVKTNSAPEAQPASMPQAKEKRAAKKAQKMEVAMDKVEPQAVEAPAGASAGIPSSDLTFGGSTTVGQPLEKENKQNLSNESAANLPSAQAPAAAPAVSNPTPITSWSGSFNPSTPESQELVPKILADLPAGPNPAFGGFHDPGGGGLDGPGKAHRRLFHPHLQPRGKTGPVGGPLQSGDTCPGFF